MMISLVNCVCFYGVWDEVLLFILIHIRVIHVTWLGFNFHCSLFIVCVTLCWGFAFFAYCLCRLLNFDADKWVHLNCALWSNEVYETMNGALMYVDSACKRGASIECVICHKPGATAGCFRPRCPNVYHIACAQKDNVTFFEDKVTVVC